MGWVSELGSMGGISRMGLFKKLSNLFVSSGDQDPSGYWIFVRCNRCGEVIRTRVDLRNDLSLEYGEDRKDYIYYCRKVLIGQKRCFQQIEVHIKFNDKRELIDREINGGEFTSEEEFIKALEEEN
jgi:hypothetical protein